MSSAARWAWVALVAGGCVWAWPTRAALAQQPADAHQDAESLFQAGRALAKEDRYAEACPKLARSYELDPAIGTLFYYAECLEHIGKLATALERYQRVAQLARETGQADRAAFAEQRIVAVRARAPKIELRLRPSHHALPGLEAKVDGAPAPSLLTQPAAFDLGAHTVVVGAPGKRPWTKTVDLSREAATTSLDVPDLSGPDEPVPPRAPDGDTARPPPAAPPRTWRTVGIVVGGVGLVGMVIGAVAGGVAVSKGNASKDPAHCDANDVCDHDGAVLRRDAITAARISTVGFIAGGALAAGGLALVLIFPRSARAPVGRLAATPSGVRMSLRW